jgi:transposase-like protein
MPWKEQRPVDQRREFVLAHLRGDKTMSQLCREFGVARKTGYKWVERFFESGLPVSTTTKKRGILRASRRSGVRRRAAGGSQPGVTLRQDLGPEPA